MAFRIYQSFIRQQMTLGVNWLETPICCMILDYRYAADVLADRYQANVYQYEVSGEGYQSGGVQLRGMGITETDQSTIFAADMLYFPAVNWQNARFGVLYASVDHPSVNPLVGVFDLQTPTPFSANVQAGSKVLTGITDMASAVIGHDVRGDGIAPGTIITEIDTGTATINRAAKKTVVNSAIESAPLVSTAGGSYQIAWSKNGVFVIQREEQ